MGQIKIVKRVVSASSLHHMLEISASSANARVQTLASRRDVLSVHSFLMRRFSLSTSDILVRPGGGHFDYRMGLYNVKMV